MEKIEWVINRFKDLETLRTPWESLWQDCADYVLPRKNDIQSKHSSGAKRNTQVYDSTAIYSNRILAAGLHGGLTSPSRPWFKLGLEDYELEEWDPVKEWLEQVERIFSQVFYRSNFYTEIHEAYLDMGAFGTPCIYVAQDPAKGLRFSARHIAEIYIAQNHLGRVDTMFRRFANFTARQAMQKWSDAVGKRIRELAEKKPDEKVEIIHAVYPREERDTSKADARNMPFASVYVDVEGKHIIAEGGYKSFPFMVARWSKNANEVYGRSPAMDALPEILSANEARKTLLKAGHKAVDPPIFLPDDGLLGGKVNLTPGATNYYRAGAGDIVIPNLAGNVPIGADMLQDMRERIKEMFFVNLFLAIINRRNMTATEVEEVAGEKMLLLGPTLGRLLSEIFDPLFDRAFEILWDAGHIPPPPEELAGRSIHVEYISPLALAQKAAQVNSIVQTYQVGAVMAQMDPEVLDNLNHDQNLRTVAELSGMDQQGLRSLREVQALRQARAQAQQQELEKQDLERMTAIAATAAKAEKEAAVQ